MAAVAERGEIHPRRVAGVRRQRVVEFARLGVAVLFVVGHDPGHIVERETRLFRERLAGRTPGAHRATAGQDGFLQEFHVRELERRFVTARRGGAALHLVHVVNHVADRRNPRVAPGGLQHGLMRGEPELVKFRQPLGHVLGVAHGLHGDQTDTRLVRGIEGFVERAALFVKRIILEHDDVNEPAFRRRVQIIRQPPVMAREPDHFHLAGTFELFGDFFVGLALGPVQGILAIIARADAMDVKSVQIRRAAGFQPRVNQLQQLLRAFLRVHLGDQENFLAALRILGQPGGKNGFRLAVQVGFRRVEIADAHGPRDVDVVGAQRPHHAAHAEHRDRRAVLAELASGQHFPGGGRRLGGEGGLREQRRRGDQGDRQRQGGFEKSAA